MEVLQEVSGIWDKYQLEKMRLYNIFGYDTKVHCFKGGEATRS
jgi:hypothetical protein